MKKYIRHLEHSNIITLKVQIDYMKNQIVSKTLVQNNLVSLTLFAFDENEEISSHTSSGDAMIQCLDGSCEITIAKDKFILKEGETIIMPSKLPHAVLAKEKFKMLLTVIFPE